MSWWLIGLILCGFVVLAVARNEGARRVGTASLQVTTDGVCRELADGREESIRWEELRFVEIVRARRGPHRASGGVVMLGGDAERGCLVPLDAVASSGLLERLAALPGMDLARLNQELGAPPGASVSEIVGGSSSVRLWERPDR